MKLKTAPAIRPRLKTAAAVKNLKAFVKGHKNTDFKAWRRATAVASYIEGKSVIDIAQVLGVARASVNRWLKWYNTLGLDGLRTEKPPGRPARLTQDQLIELSLLVEGGPQDAGFDGGVWTGPMIADLIRKRYGVSYHHHHIPRLLHKLGFSVQRPRKRLSRADAEKQALWLSKRLPAIKKKPGRAAA